MTPGRSLESQKLGEAMKVKAYKCGLYSLQGKSDLSSRIYIWETFVVLKSYQYFQYEELGK